MRPAIAFLIAVAILLVAGILTPSEAMHGFANEQLAVIVMLLILSNTLGKSQIIDRLFGAFFKQKDSPRTFMLKMLSGVSVSSAFLNNTPLVAMMMPYVNQWSKDHKLSVSKFLIPLSYASILGGCVTLIGTSTNLIANGLAIEYGEEGLGIFDFVYVGLPMMVIGILYLMLFGNKLLPTHISPTDHLPQDREYCVETVVNSASPLIGKSVEDAGLRNMKGLYLAEIIKENRVVRPAPPDVLLAAGDILLFVGDTAHIAELTKPKLGLGLPEASTLPQKELDSLVELVVSHSSTLVDQKVMDSNFRSLFNGAIMAVHRDGEAISGKIGDVVLRPGDMLMVLAGRDFLSRIESSKDFYLLSRIKGLESENIQGAVLLVTGLIISIGLAVLNWVPLFTSLAVLVVASIVLGLQKVADLKSKVDFDLIIIIAMGLALGKGMINSGLAILLADQTAGHLQTSGTWVILAGLFLITNLLTAFMTSKAAVAIVLPIALSTAHAMGIPIPAIILIVAYGGAASFITPIGYQTNLMVYGPGGYSFKDYLRIGLPLTLIYCVVAVLVLLKLYMQ
jgi:di/tricarboxylate transporter